MRLGDMIHKHRHPQALAGCLARQKLAPALGKMPALAIMLRVLVHQETGAQTHRVLAVLLP